MSNVPETNFLDINEYIGESFFGSETYRLFPFKKTLFIKCKKDKRVFCTIDSRRNELHTLRFDVHVQLAGNWCMDVLTDIKSGEIIADTRLLYGKLSHKYKNFPLVVDCNGTPSIKCRHDYLSEIIITAKKYIFVHTRQIVFGFIGGAEKISILNMDGEELISRHYYESFFTIHKEDTNIELLAILFYCGYRSTGASKFGGG